MAYLDSNARTTKVTKADQGQQLGRSGSLPGVYMGFVKRVDDVQRNGRLQVWIPELGSAPEQEHGWITVSYCSPFAGATNVDTTSKTDIQGFEGTQTSYGMWFVPPDINNTVMVMFINGDPSKGIWIGSLFGQYMNNMVPAMAAGTHSYQYPGKTVPVAEYNKQDTKVTQPDRAFRPYQATKFKGLGNQGLITDTRRGVTDSSARRESPSQVFGIITPGPAISSEAIPGKIRRKGGSSFVMDDAASNEYIQLATKSGAQININETNGFIYLINRDGTSWVQMDEKGNIDIFGAGDISMRAQRDFNIRADRNINIESGQNIFMKAAKDTKEGKVPFTRNINNKVKKVDMPVWNYVGAGKGDGGNIVTHALNNWHSTSQKNAYLTVVESNMDIKIGNSLSLTTQRGGQGFNSKQGIKLTTDAAVDVSASGNIRVGAKGSVSVVGVAGVVLCTDASMSLNASGNMIAAAAGTMSLDAAGLEIGTATKMPSLDVGSIKANSTQSGSMKSDTIVYDGQAIGGGGPASPSDPATLNTISAEGALSANTARPAEVKPLNQKLNILATWKDQDSKFHRNSEALLTTVSRFPTFEPCPEHTTFSKASVAGGKPAITADDTTYAGSSAAGTPAVAPPAASKNPGAENTAIKGDPPSDSNIAADLNINALRCQLIIHEGLKDTSYADTRGLLTAGIGHLLRTNEITKYPLGSPISAEQIETWYTQDASSAIKIAQSLFATIWDSLSDVRKRAVTDLAYNLGKAGLAKFVNFIAAMNAGAFDKAGMELRNSAWFKQVARRGPNIITMIVQNIDPNGCDKKFPG